MSKKNSSAKRSWLGRLFFGGSKGLADEADQKSAELEAVLRRASDNGRYPIVLDASACSLRATSPPSRPRARTSRRWPNASRPPRAPRSRP